MSRTWKRALTATAALALAWFGWCAWRDSIGGRADVAEVTLWTQGANAPSGGTGLNVALHAVSEMPPGTLIVPDVAYLRRAYPKLRHVSIVGHGVTADEAEALKGVEVSWRRTASSPSQPSFVSVVAPHEIALGSRFAVEGAVIGLTEGEVMTVTLTAPNGAVQQTEIRGSGAGARVPFSIDSPPAAAVGEFEWILGNGARGEKITLGARVRAPVMPRVLMLQESPSPEFARLQRWLGDTGGRVTLRTRVSAEHMRWMTANGARGEFGALDEAVLREFDLVLTTEAAWRRLGVEERASLEDGVRRDALGVLFVGEASADAGTEVKGILAPWLLPSVDAEVELRSVRLRLADGDAIDEPVATLPVELPRRALARELVTDPHGRLIVAALAVGRGWVGRTVVTDSWQWLQRGKSAEYGRFWTTVIAEIARPNAAGASWSYWDSARPLFVDEPVQLSRARSRDMSSENAVVWPTRAGWNTLNVVASPAKAGPIVSDDQEVKSATDSFRLYAQPKDALIELQKEERRRVTARLVEESRHLSADSEEQRAAGILSGEADTAWWAFGVFVAAAGGLWWAERRART